MDIHRIIQELHEERERLDRVIKSIESFAGDEQEAPAPTKRRGRRTMSQEERRQVSQRMRKYWESRRKK